MDKTEIDCPSCNRRIRIALIRPLVHLELKSEEFPGCYLGKDYDLRDLLGIYHDLLSEVRKLRNKDAVAQENLNLRRMLKGLIKGEFHQELVNLKNYLQGEEWESE